MSSRRIAALGCVACLLMLAVATSAGASDAAERACRDVVLSTGSGAVYTRTHRLRARNASCRLARRVARIYLHGSEGEGHVEPLRFRCRDSTRGVACHRGDRRVRWKW